MVRKRRIVVGLMLWFGLAMGYAQTMVSIPDTENWEYRALEAYVGKTIVFDKTMYVTSNAYGKYYVGPRRLFSPTNQALPLSEAYELLARKNSYGQMAISGLPGYHRSGERIKNLCVKVLSANSLEYVSGEFVGNTRADLLQSLPALNQKGEPRLVVCAMNLEYYMVEQFQVNGTMGPQDAAEHQKQRTKVSAALAQIGADIYGLIEIQQGQNAVQEIADDLSTKTGYEYGYIDDGGSANGSYTKSAYVYRKDKVEPVYKMYENNAGVQNRKKMQCFREISTGEEFIFSLNHFKAKSGSGSGLDADQDDGQGGFNYARTQEALSVINQYNAIRQQIKEEDILVMGDLNAYAKEDPITAFTAAGMYDLHRAFHADSSYSYVFGGKAGYLDHAICNASLYAQVTGMAAYHINSDESDEYTYDKSSDETMFRCSDHDPVLVGLALDKTLLYDPTMRVCKEGNGIVIYNANTEEGSPAYYRIYTMQGRLVDEKKITSNQFDVVMDMPSGVYVVQVYYKGRVEVSKIIR